MRTAAFCNGCKIDAKVVLASCPNGMKQHRYVFDFDPKIACFFHSTLAQTFCRQEHSVNIFYNRTS